MHLTYLFKHVAGSVASPLHMVERQRFQSQCCCCKWRQGDNTVLVPIAVFSSVRQKAAGVSTPSCGFIAPERTMTENWPITMHGERKTEGGQAGRERGRKLGRKITAVVPKTKGVFICMCVCVRTRVRVWVRVEKHLNKLSEKLAIVYRTTH